MGNIQDFKTDLDANIFNNPPQKIRGNVLNDILEKLYDYLILLDPDDDGLIRIIKLEEPSGETVITSADNSDDRIIIWDDTDSTWKVISPGNFSAGGTDLSIGSRTTTTFDIESSTGNNATAPAASATEAGLLSSTMFNRIQRSINSTGTLTSAATIACDTNTSLSWNLTLNNTGATLNITNMLDGETVVIRVVQGTTGGTITTINVNGTAADLNGEFSTSSGDIDIIAVTLFGTNSVATIG